jgi:hypothetical protein
LAIVTVGCKSETGTINVPTGGGTWTQIGSTVTGGTGVTGVDVGQSRVAKFYKVLTGSETGNVTCTGTSTGNIQAVMDVYAGSIGNGWETPINVSGNDSSHGTNPSAVLGAWASALAVDDYVHVGYATDTDNTGAASAFNLTQTGTTYGTKTARSRRGNSDGNDGSTFTWDAPVTAGGSTNAPTAAFTWAASSCGPMIATRLRETPAPPDVPGTPNYETTGSYGQSPGLSPGPNVTCGVPAGVIANNIVELRVFMDTTGSTATPPTGFVDAPDSPQTISANQRQHVWWKRATGAESGTYTVTFSPDSYAEAVAVRYSACIDTGNPYDDTDSDQIATNTTTSPPVDVTTTGADRLIVHSATNWAGGTWTPSTGFTTRVTGGFGQIHVATKLQAAAGASGSVVATCTGNDKQTAWLGALKGAAGGTTEVTQSYDLRWQVANQVTQSYDLRWLVRNAVSQSYDLRWLVRNAISQSYDLRWQVRQQATQSYDLRWQVRQAVTQPYDLRWLVRNEVVQSYDLRWVSFAQALASYDLRWRVANLVSQSYDVRWQVFNTIAAQSYDLRWLVHNEITQSYDLRWQVRQLVQQSYDLRWQVRQLATQSYDLRWIVRNAVTQSYDLRWVVDSTLVTVTQNYDLRWLVRQQVTQPYDLRWRVSNAVLESYDLRWQVRNLATQQWDVRWQVHNEVTQAYDLRWRVYGLVLNSYELLWVVTAADLPTVPFPADVTVQLVEETSSGFLAPQEKGTTTYLDRGVTVYLEDGTGTQL